MDFEPIEKFSIFFLMWNTSTGQLTNLIPKLKITAIDLNIITNCSYDYLKRNIISTDSNL